MRRLILSFLVLTALISMVGTGTPISRAAEVHPNSSVSSPSPALPRLGSDFQISQQSSGYEGDAYAPAIAYNNRHGEYLVVYHKKYSFGAREILARRVSNMGQLLDVSESTISFVGTQNAQPAVAYNYTNDQYLIVWMNDPTGTMGSNSLTEIWGKLCSYPLSCGSDFMIFKWANRGFWTPRVAWNSIRNEYFVIWNAVDTTTGLANDIAGVHVSPSGAVDSLPHGITSAKNPTQSDLVYNLAANEYFVVWRYAYSAADGDIYAARVKFDGSVNATITVNGSTSDQQFPAVTTNQQGYYLVAWQERSSGLDPWHLYLQELDVNGNPVGSAANATNLGDSQTNPAVVATPGVGRDYMIVWQATTQGVQSVLACHIVVQTGLAPNICFTYFPIKGATAWDYTLPKVAKGGPGYLVAYQGTTSAIPTFSDIYGRMWWPQVFFIPLITR